LSWSCFAQGFGGEQSSGDLSGFQSTKNIDYVGDNHVGHKLDIYYPNDGKSTHNVIIHIYGSAWGSNDSKGSADLGTVGKAALNAGYIFVTPNHRTYNDALYPAQIQDIKAVVRYLRGNKSDLKIDDSFIAISGFSSGGHLASLMGVTRNVEGNYTVGSTTMDIEGKLGKFTDQSSWVDAVCDWSGPVDCRNSECGSHMNMGSLPEDGMCGGCSKTSCPDKHALLAATTFIDETDAPFMICHGSGDNIVPQCEGKQFYNDLKAGGVEATFYDHSGGHGVNGEFTDEMVSFFNKAREAKAAQGEGGEGGGEVTGDPKDKFHVYIAIGQSNMWGNAQVTQADKATNDRIKMMSTADSRGNVGTWLPAVPPMCAPSAGYSLSDNFIRTMANEMPECVTIGIIPVAIAGTKFVIYDPNQCSSYISGEADWLKNMAKEYGNDPYNRIIKCAKIAQETGVIKGIILHQGESDNGSSTWTTQVATFYNNICKDLGLDPKKTPLIAGQMVEGGSCAGHNSVIAQLPSKITNCGIVETSGIPGESDRLHFTHDGYTELGKRYAQKMISLFDTTGTAAGCSASGKGGGGGTVEDQTPYKGIATDVPGKVEAENFDEGGQGVAYSDSDTQENSGTINYRSESVDFVSGNNGTAIGYTTTSEWMEYTINVTKAGTYYVGAMMSNGSGDPSVDLSIDGNKVATITGTGVSSDWDTYAMGTSASTVNLTEGEHIMKVAIAAANTNIDYILISAEKIGEGGQGGGGGQIGDSDACAEHSLPSSGGQKITANGVKDFGSKGYNLELWGADGGSMTVYPDADCAFTAEWNNPGDFLARVGYYWNGQKGSYKDLGDDIQADFNFSFTGSGGNYNYIGIYGWTKTPKECEYYIVENTFFKSTNKQNGLYWNANVVGTYTLDGDTYTLYKGIRDNAPSISGTSTFPQLFAVRKTARYCGHLSVSEHFRQWEKLGVDMGGNIYDCKLLCEAGGGQGTFQMKYGKIWLGKPDTTGDEVIPSSENVNGIVISPNPAQNNFSISSDKEILRVELINMMGQIVLSQESAENINIAVPAGMYFVKAYAADGASYIEKLQVK
jgi:acetyl esterase/lipase